MNSPRGRNSLVLFILLMVVAVLVYQFRSGANQPERLPLNEAAAKIKSGEIVRVIVDENELELIFQNGEKAFSRKEPTKTAVEQFIDLGVAERDLAAANIALEIKEPSDLSTVISLVTYILPALLVVGLIWLMLRQAQGSNNQAISFGKSRARMFAGDQPTVTFEDVAGVEEAKEELQEVVEFLQEPDKFITLGARIPKGVLLIG
ncbi:MAG: ATP-dependent metallopeptidase FtsH/Yme1/Tma family protein, partial [Anaerolineales bacterium]